MWQGRAHLSQLPRLEGSNLGCDARGSWKKEAGGFSRHSAVISAQLSKEHSDLCVTSPNQYALLESDLSSSTRCITNGSQPKPNKTIFPTKPIYTKLVPWAKEHAQMHQWFCKRESCYWHHPGDQFDEKEYEDGQGLTRTTRCWRRKLKQDPALCTGEYSITWLWNGSMCGTG